MQQLPWVDWSNNETSPEGVEVALIQQLAKELSSEVQWVEGSDSKLMKMLERFELDVVIGGIIEDTPWKDQIALSCVFHTSTLKAQDDPNASPIRNNHVWAVAPGENGWLLRIDSFLNRNKKSIPQLLKKHSSDDYSSLKTETDGSFVRV